MNTDSGKPKKPFYKQWWFILLAVLVVISLAFDRGDDGIDGDVVTQDADAHEEVEVEEPVIEEPEEGLEDLVENKPSLGEPVLSSNDEDDLVATMLTLIEDAYSETGDVRYNEDDKVFSIIPTDIHFSEAVAFAKAGDEMVLESWQSLVRSVISVQGLISETLGDDYILSIVNPINTENTLIMVGEGVVYEAVSEEFRLVEDY